MRSLISDRHLIRGKIESLVSYNFYFMKLDNNFGTNNVVSSWDRDT